MDEAHTVRHRVLVQGISRRQVAREMGVSRNTVRRYIEGAEPGVRRPTERPRPIFEAVRGRMEELLESSGAWTAGKQRLTAWRLHEMLLGEGYSVGYTTVKRYFREWRRSKAEVFVPLEYRSGDLAEVDFFEVIVEVAGKRRKAFMFLMRLMYSGADFLHLYDRQDQVSFLDGHVRAFEHLGFVPRRILYDNLKPAVTKILAGSKRQLAERFERLAQHYLFEPCFARPYTGHDKGGVESRGRSIRRRYMVPIPVGESLAAISVRVLSRIEVHKNKDRFAEERSAALAKPDVSFVAAACYSPRASRRALVSVEGAYYSVLSDWAGLFVTARVWPDRVEVIGPDGRRVEHPRLRSGQRSVNYRHFLRELSRKPNAVRQVAHRLVHDLGDPWPLVWARLRESSVEARAARMFAELLRGVEAVGLALMSERLRALLDANQPPLMALSGGRVAELPDRAIPEVLRNVRVESGCAANFNRLLGGVV